MAAREIDRDEGRRRVRDLRRQEQRASAGRSYFEDISRPEANLFQETKDLLFDLNRGEKPIRMGEQTVNDLLERMYLERQPAQILEIGPKQWYTVSAVLSGSSVDARVREDPANSLRAGGQALQLTVPVFLFACALSLHWYIGTFRSEFGRYPDEGMHFISGLLIHDYIASGHWAHPVAFAKEYYLHFPKVGLGNWPPAFPVLQAVWTLVFGTSRNAVLCLMILLQTLLASMVYREGRKRLSGTAALFGAVLLVALPLSQALTAAVMAEVPLALFSFLAVLSYIHFVETGQRRDAIRFALWSSLAIGTKGNGWAIVVAAAVSLPVVGRMHLLKSRQLWLGIGVITFLCVPYTVLTMHIVRNGWNTLGVPGVSYIARALGIHAALLGGTVGASIVACAALGVLDWVVVGGVRRNADLFWLGLAVYAGAIVIFHSVVPTSIEPRKIYQAVPVLCLFAAAGTETMRRSIARVPLPPIVVRSAPVSLASVLFVTTAYRPVPPFSPGIAAAVATLGSHADTDHAAILVSSNPFLADAEAAIIAEWASREHRSRAFLVRATKLLARAVRTSRDEMDYPVAYRSSEGALQVLNAIPISYVIVHSTPAPRSYPHDTLLNGILEGHQDEWERIYDSRRLLDQPHEIRIYKLRRDVSGVPVHLSVDLTDKIGSSLEAVDVRN